MDPSSLSVDPGSSSKRTADPSSPSTVDAKRARLEDQSPSNLSESQSSGKPATGASLPGSTSPVNEQTNDVEMKEASGSSGNIPSESSPTKGKSKETKPKEKKRGRTGWRNRNAEGPETERLDANGEPVSRAPRYPKRQCALLLGFCGSGYSGMQVQPQALGLRTIEGSLFDALVKVGAVSQDNSDNPTKVALARAARTDAGVHAAGNVVSLKMIMHPPGVKDVVEAINQQLPPEIRLWGYARAQNSFNARLICESRKYTYYFPSYMLLPPKPGSGLQQALNEYDARTRGESFVPPPPTHDFWAGHEEASTEEDMARKRVWRVGPEPVQRLRELVQKYEGTHNFHNFTVGRDFADRSNNRHMKSIEIADPVVYGETEWIAVLFHGQSFMLHQIRKMMTALVLACRFNTPPSFITELYNPHTVFVPKMPALGLLLEEPLFTAYNKRMKVINEKLQPTDFEYRPVIDFDVHREKINAFKEEFIYKNMREIEDRDGIFDAWIRMLDIYSGNDLLYFNSSGTVPDESVLKKKGSRRRPNPFKERRIFDSTSFTARDEVKKKLEAAEDLEEEDEEEEGVMDKRQLEEAEG